MYIQSVDLKDYRNFSQGNAVFGYPKGNREKWDNINLILGPNGSGKTTLLRAIATGVIWELLPRYAPRYIVRNRADGQNGLLDSGREMDQGRQFDMGIESARIVLKAHADRDQDLVKQQTFCQEVAIDRERGLSGKLAVPDASFSRLLYKEDSPSFFMVGYGATRWTPIASQYDIPEARNRRYHIRFQRVASLFEDNYGLMPLEAWLRGTGFSKPQLTGRILDLIQSLLPPELPKVAFFEGEQILFQGAQNISLPQSELSDGYRSYLSWICDLAYHLASVSSNTTDLKDICGVVLIDEIDLHLHPKWQQTALGHISSQLPNLQFILTSHSPLVAGTLPAANILMMDRDEDGFPKVVHLQEEIQGRDADQILRSASFDLKSTRTPEFADQVGQVYQQAARGDWDAALKIMDLYSRGSSALKDQKGA